MGNGSGQPITLDLYVQLRKGSFIFQPLIFKVGGFPRVGRYNFAVSIKNLGNLLKQKHPDNRLGTLKGRLIFQPIIFRGYCNCSYSFREDNYWSWLSVGHFDAFAGCSVNQHIHWVFCLRTVGLCCVIVGGVGGFWRVWHKSGLGLCFKPIWWWHPYL